MGIESLSVLLTLDGESASSSWTVLTDADVTILPTVVKDAFHEKKQFKRQFFGGKSLDNKKVILCFFYQFMQGRHS